LGIGGGRQDTLSEPRGWAQDVVYAIKQGSRERVVRRHYRSHQLTFCHRQISDRTNLENDHIRGLQVAGARGEVDEVYFATRLTDVERDSACQEKETLAAYGILEGSDPRFTPLRCTLTVWGPHARFPRQDQGQVPLALMEPRARSSEVLRGIFEETRVPQTFSWSAPHGAPYYEPHRSSLRREDPPRFPSVLIIDLRWTFPASGPRPKTPERRVGGDLVCSEHLRGTINQTPGAHFYEVMYVFASGLTCFACLKYPDTGIVQSRETEESPETRPYRLTTHSLSTLRPNSKHILVPPTVIGLFTQMQGTGARNPTRYADYNTQCYSICGTRADATVKPQAKNANRRGQADEIPP